MSRTNKNKSVSGDKTLPSRNLMDESRFEPARGERKIVQKGDADEPPTKLFGDAPWMLRQHIAGKIDLASELGERYPNTPLMSQVRFRFKGDRSKHDIATLATQDGAARLLIDVDAETMEVTLTFMLDSMLSQGFRMENLSDVDRVHWLERMKRSTGGVAFLWGKSRWQHDYVIFAVREYYTGVYAFSTQHAGAAARLTPDVTAQLLEWLEAFWRPKPIEELEDENGGSLSW